MSWQSQVHAIEAGKSYELEPPVRFLLMILANYADPEGNDIYPTVETLMDDTGMGRTTVKRHLNTLKTIGLLELGNQHAVDRMRKDRRPTVYRLNFDANRTLKPVDNSPERGPEMDRRTVHGGPNTTSTGVQTRVQIGPQTLRKENKPTRAHTRGEDRECSACGKLTPDDLLTESGLCDLCTPVSTVTNAGDPRIGVSFKDHVRQRREARERGDPRISDAEFFQQHQAETGTP